MNTSLSAAPKILTPQLRSLRARALKTVGAPSYLPTAGPNDTARMCVIVTLSVPLHQAAAATRVELDPRVCIRGVGVVGGVSASDRRVRLEEIVEFVELLQHSAKVMAIK